MQCTRYLLEEGANVSVEDNKGRRVLAYTMGNNYHTPTNVVNYIAFVDEPPRCL
jgi:hypothetical protein